MDFSSFKSAGSTWLSNLKPADIAGGLQRIGLIKVSKPPTSNLTSNQVSSGQNGSIQGIQSQSSDGMPKWFIPVMGVLGVIILVFVMKRK